MEVKLSKPVLVAPVRLHIHPLCLYCCVQGEHDTFLGDVAASYPCQPVSPQANILWAIGNSSQARLAQSQWKAVLSAALWIKEEHWSAS